MSKRRRVLLVDRKFQIRFSLYVCSWIFALSLIYPAVIYSIFEWIIRYAESHLTGDSLVFLRGIKKEFLYNLVMLQTSFLGLTFLISLFLSHKIAGPIYKLRLFMAEARQGNLGPRLVFRKHDHFVALAEDYNDLIASFRDRMNENIETVSTAMARVENAISKSSPEGRQALEDVLVELRKVRERSSV